MAESIEDSSSSNDETFMDEDEFQQFTTTLDQFTPAIPPAVTQYYMRQSGLQTDDERAVKLLSVSVQKFMSGKPSRDQRRHTSRPFADIINDCFQLNKLREKSINRPGTALATPAGATATVAPPATTETATASSDPAVNAMAGKKPVVSTNNTLTLSDLTHVLDEYGINVKKTFYYT